MAFFIVFFGIVAYKQHASTYSDEVSSGLARMCSLVIHFAVEPRPPQTVYYTE